MPASVTEARRCLRHLSTNTLQSRAVYHAALYLAAAFQLRSLLYCLSDITVNRIQIWVTCLATWILESCVRWKTTMIGTLHMHRPMLQYFAGNLQCKNFQNRFPFVQIIIENQVSCSWDTVHYSSADTKRRTYFALRASLCLLLARQLQKSSSFIAIWQPMLDECWTRRSQILLIYDARDSSSGALPLTCYWQQLIPYCTAGSRKITMLQKFLYLCLSSPSREANTAQHSISMPRRN